MGKVDDNIETIRAIKMEINISDLFSS